MLELGTYDSSLPKPGDLLLQDYRDNDKASQAWIATARGRPVRVVQWNIERGYKFDEIVQTLKILDADVLLLQEIDVGCDRSGQRDVGMQPHPTAATADAGPCRHAMPAPHRTTYPGNDTAPLRQRADCASVALHLVQGTGMQSSTVAE